MKTEYQRNLTNNYLILEPEEEIQTEDYIFHMAKQNKIEGFLLFHVKKIDGKSSLYYDITSRKQLCFVYEKRVMGYEDIRRILANLQEIIENMRKYLLNPKHILFAPEYLYQNQENGKIEVCYYPIRKEKEETDVIRLAEFFLKRLDHKDERAIALGYRFYEKTSEPNFSLPDTLRDILAGEVLVKRKPDLVQEEPFWEEEEIPEPVGKKNDEKLSEKRSRKGNLLLYGISGSVFLLCGIDFFLLYRNILTLSQAGGIFFLVLAAAVFLYRLLHKKINHREKQVKWVKEEDDEEFRELQMEMYRKDENQTSCLYEEPVYQSGGILLVCEEIGRYPDIEIGTRRLVVGKLKGQADIVLKSPAVSRIHARLEGTDGKCFIQDMNSKNGTFVNGIRLEAQEKMEIQNGDLIGFADISYQAVRKQEAGETQLLG